MYLKTFTPKRYRLCSSSQGDGSEGERQEGLLTLASSTVGHVCMAGDWEGLGSPPK